MECKECGGNSLKFRWEYEEEDETTLYLCHDGWGFQLEDSIITCSKCGKESDYGKEDFVTTTKTNDGGLD